MKVDRNIKALMAFSLLIGITIGFNFTMLPIHINTTLGGNLFWVGLIGSLQYLAFVIMTFVWGAISDRLGQRRNVIIIANLIATGFYFVMPYADLYLLAVLRGIQVVFIASWLIAYVMATEYRPDAKGKIIGMFTVFNAFGWGAGAFISGFAYAADPTWFFYITGIFSALSAVALIPAVDPPLKKNKSSEIFSIFKLDNIREILKLCTTVFVLLTGTYMVFSVFSVYLGVNGIPEAAIGVVIALSGLPSAVLASIVGNMSDKYGRKIILLIAILMYAAIWLVYGITDNIWLVIVLWLIPAYIFYTISTTAMISDLSPSQQRGRGVGLLNSFYNMGAFTGSIAGGALAGWFGFKPTFLVAALAVLISFTLALRLKETHKIKP